MARLGAHTRGVALLVHLVSAGPWIGVDVSLLFVLSAGSLTPDLAATIAVFRRWARMGRRHRVS